MTLTQDHRLIGDRCRLYLDAALPKRAKVKTLQGILGLSHASAERIAAGQTPTTAHLVTLAHHFGRAFLDFIFADVIERPSSVDLAALEAMKGALHEEKVVAASPAAAVATVAEVGSVRAGPRATDF